MAFRQATKCSKRVCGDGHQNDNGAGSNAGADVRVEAVDAVVEFDFVGVGRPDIIDWLRSVGIDAA